MLIGAVLFMALASPPLDAEQTRHMEGVAECASADATARIHGGNHDRTLLVSQTFQRCGHLLVISLEDAGRPDQQANDMVRAAISEAVDTALKASSAPGAIGRLKICRYPGLTELMDRKSVTIPAGTGYGSGDTKSGEQLKPYFLVKTLEAATLPPKPGCVTVPAQMAENPEHFHLTPSYPTFLPSQLGVAGLEDIARIVSEFK
jgi:hypothetical protein